MAQPSLNKVSAEEAEALAEFEAAPEHDALAEFEAAPEVQPPVGKAMSWDVPARDAGAPGLSTGIVSTLDTLAYGQGDTFAAIPEAFSDEGFSAARDRIGREITNAKQDNPVGGIVGSLVGEVGKQALLAPFKAVTIPARVIQQGALGAASQIGQDNPQSLRDQAASVLKGFGSGALAGLLGGGVSKATARTLPAAKTAAEGWQNVSNNPAVPAAAKSLLERLSTPALYQMTDKGIPALAAAKGYAMGGPAGAALGYSGARMVASPVYKASKAVVSKLNDVLSSKAAGALGQGSLRGIATWAMKAQNKIQEAGPKGSLDRAVEIDRQNATNPAFRATNKKEE